MHIAVFLVGDLNVAHFVGLCNVGTLIIYQIYISISHDIHYLVQILPMIGGT